jgi:hypothetical protein
MVSCVVCGAEQVSPLKAVHTKMPVVLKRPQTSESVKVNNTFRDKTTDKTTEASLAHFGRSAGSAHHRNDGRKQYPQVPFSMREMETCLPESTVFDAHDDHIQGQLPSSSWRRKVNDSLKDPVQQWTQRKLASVEDHLISPKRAQQLIAERHQLLESVVPTPPAKPDPRSSSLRARESHAVRNEQLPLTFLTKEVRCVEDRFDTYVITEEHRKRRELGDFCNRNVPQGANGMEHIKKEAVQLALSNITFQKLVETWVEPEEPARAIQSALPVAVSVRPQKRIAPARHRTHGQSKHHDLPPATASEVTVPVVDINLSGGPGIRTTYTPLNAFALKN